MRTSLALALALVSSQMVASSRDSDEDMTQSRSSSVLSLEQKVVKVSSLQQDSDAKSAEDTSVEVSGNHLVQQKSNKTESSLEQDAESTEVQQDAESTEDKSTEETSGHRIILQNSTGHRFAVHNGKMSEIQEHQESHGAASDGEDVDAAHKEQDQQVEHDQHEEHEEQETSRVTPEMRLKVAEFSKAAVAALEQGRDPNLSSAEKQKHMQAALAQAASVMLSLAQHVDLKKHPDIAQKMEKLQKLATMEVPTDDGHKEIEHKHD